MWWVSPSAHFNALLDGNSATPNESPGRGGPLVFPGGGRLLGCGDDFVATFSSSEGSQGSLGSRLDASFGTADFCLDPAPPLLLKIFPRSGRLLGCGDDFVATFSSSEGSQGSLGSRLDEGFRTADFCFDPALPLLFLFS
jgi:hypothetical protein